MVFRAKEEKGRQPLRGRFLTQTKISAEEAQRLYREYNEDLRENAKQWLVIDYCLLGKHNVGGRPGLYVVGCVFRFQIPKKLMRDMKSQALIGFQTARAGI